MKKILTFIGGDMRQIHAIKKLHSIGYEIHTYGIFNENILGISIQHSNYASLPLDNLILPVPMLGKDGYIKNNLSDIKTQPMNLLNMLDYSSFLIAGKIEANTKKYCNNNDIAFHDLLDDEMFCIANAIPSAEGVLRQLITRMNYTIWNSNGMILGSGRIAKLLYKLLNNMGCNVHVVARKPHERLKAEYFGCNSICFEQLDNSDILSKMDFVINTVPAKVLYKNRIDRLNNSTIIIDIASNNGGTDFEYANKEYNRAFLESSLPGRLYPVTAGYILADSIDNVINNMKD